jgi:hypothetical protein
MKIADLKFLNDKTTCDLTSRLECILIKTEIESIFILKYHYNSNT